MALAAWFYHTHPHERRTGKNGLRALLNACPYLAVAVDVFHLLPSVSFLHCARYVSLATCLSVIPCRYALMRSVFSCPAACFTAGSGIPFVVRKRASAIISRKLDCCCVLLNRFVMPLPSYLQSRENECCSMPPIHIRKSLHCQFTANLVDRCVRQPLIPCGEFFA